MDALAHIWTDYDQEADIFYVRLRPDVQDARTDEAGHGVLIDWNPSTGEVLGLKILGFLGHFAACRDLAWLVPLGIPDEVLHLIRQKAQEIKQSACSQESVSSPSE